MTVQLPDRIPLLMPPGDAHAIADLARDVGTAARCLAAVDARISGPAVDAPGWLGDDASAAAAQVVAVDALIRSAYDAVTSAGHRVAAHAERLLETRSQVRALRQEQDEHFRRATSRWYGLPDLQAQLMTDGPDVRAIVADLEAGEASRRRRHHALLEEVEDDAAATSRVLVDSCAAVGGLGRRGDANRAVAYLAAELPGWGDRELGRRAHVLIQEFGVVSPGEWNRHVHEMAAFAGVPAFATALLGELGQGGLRSVLGRLGRRRYSDDMDGRSSAVARFFATVLGAAARQPQDSTEPVLSGTYVDDDGSGIDSDYIAMGMAMVLVAGGPSGGPAPLTVAAWTRQVLAREHALAGAPDGARALDRVYPNAQFDGVTAEDSFRRFDPVPVLVHWLADHGTPRAAAAALGEPGVWTVLLDRSWDDGAGALAHVVSLAAEHPGASGARAARSGLEAIGAGLVEGEPSQRTVDRHVVAAVAPALGDLVAAHVTVATTALEEVSGGSISEASRDVLRGLGQLTVDRAAAQALAAALQDWATVQPHDLVGSSHAAPLPAIAVPSAYVAVQQYGQRLSYALDQDEAREEADFKQRIWTAATVPLVLIGGPAGIAAGIGAGYLAIAVDMDGTWTAEPDPGPVLDGTDAGMAASAQVPTLGSEDDTRLVVAAQARTVYQRAVGLLGMPLPPVSPDADFVAPLVSALEGLVWARVTRDHELVQGFGNVLDSLFG